MTNIKKLSFIILCLMVTGFTKAQFEKLNLSDLKEIKNRDIIVIVETPLDKISSKSGKKGSSDNSGGYQTALDRFNKDFKDVVQKYWKFSSPNFQFMTMEDLNGLLDRERRKYMVFYCHSAEGNQLGSSYPANPGIIWGTDVEEKNRVRGYENYYTEFGISFMDVFKKPPFIHLGLADIFPAKSDLIYAVETANKYCSDQLENNRRIGDKELADMLNQNNDQLRDKTLLLKREFVDPHLSKEDLEKAYPYAYEIVGKDTLDRMLDADTSASKYAYAMVIPFPHAEGNNKSVSMVDFVVSADDGTLLGAAMPGLGVTPLTAFTSQGAKRCTIGKKNLADICQYTAGSEKQGGKGKGKKKK